MCEVRDASREVRRCAEALTLACILSHGLQQLWGSVALEPVPQRLLSVLDKMIPAE